MVLQNQLAVTWQPEPSSSQGRTLASAPIDPDALALLLSKSNLESGLDFMEALHSLDEVSPTAAAGIRG
jgi:hypothetical protein